jgi:hypothetical protein
MEEAAEMAAKPAEIVLRGQIRTIYGREV